MTDRDHDTLYGLAYTTDPSADPAIGEVGYLVWAACELLFVCELASLRLGRPKTAAAPGRLLVTTEQGYDYLFTRPQPRQRETTVVRSIAATLSL